MEWICKRKNCSFISHTFPLVNTTQITSDLPLSPLSPTPSKPSASNGKVLPMLLLKCHFISSPHTHWYSPCSQAFFIYISKFFRSKSNLRHVCIREIKWHCPHSVASVKGRFSPASPTHVKAVRPPASPASHPPATQPQWTQYFCPNSCEGSPVLTGVPYLFQNWARWPERWTQFVDQQGSHAWPHLPICLQRAAPSPAPGLGLPHPKLHSLWV